MDQKDKKQAEEAVEEQFGDSSEALKEALAVDETVEAMTDGDGMPAEVGEAVRDAALVDEAAEKKAAADKDAEPVPAAKAEAPAATVTPFPAEPAQAMPAVKAPASADKDARIQHEIEEVGQRRARKVYDWLGFLGGAFAVALGVVVLTATGPEGGIVFRGDFYTSAYEAIGQVASILKLGFFGLLEALGLALLGLFGPRLMKAERK